MAKATIPDPTTQGWLAIAEGFEKNANFPHCIGALDGKHIRIIKPAHSGSMYFNYKNYFSIVLLAMCDSNYMLTFVDIGAFGKSSDSGVFKNSRLFEKIVAESLNLPAPTSIEGNGENEMPYVIVGDEAFPLSTNLLRPFGGKFLNHKQKVFNYRLSRARRYIECTFGILANKWRIFHRPLNVDIDLAESIVKACCVLHNFVRQRDGVRTDENSCDFILSHIRKDSTSRGNQKSLAIREQFADYFVNVNPLAWQDDMI